MMVIYIYAVYMWYFEVKRKTILRSSIYMVLSTVCVS